MLSCRGGGLVKNMNINKILLVRGVLDKGASNGGIAYTNSIMALFGEVFPGVEIEQQCFFSSAAEKSRHAIKVKSIAKSLLSTRPSKVEHFFSRKFADKINALISVNGYDLVVINGIDMAWLSDCIPAGQYSIYISHNIEQALFKQQISRYSKIPLLCWFLDRDLQKLVDYELGSLQKSSGVIAISETDRQWLLERLPGLNVITLLPSFKSPVPERTRSKRQGTGKRLNLGFLGNMQWWPNRRSIDWFIEQVLPHIGTDFQLHLFGNGSQSLHDGASIIGHGFVDDLQTIWDTVDIMIQPIVAGAGVNIKVAETLYNRVPMLATPMALKGLPLLDDDAIVTREAARDWIAWFNSEAPAALSTTRIREENAALFTQSAALRSLRLLCDSSAS